MDTSQKCEGGLKEKTNKKHSLRRQCMIFSDVSAAAEFTLGHFSLVLHRCEMQHLVFQPTTATIFASVSQLVKT